MSGGPGPGDVRDAPERWRVTGSETRYEGSIFTVRHDRVEMPDGRGGVEEVGRDIVAHAGSVAVLALDDDGRVLLLNQYRHAVGARLWELPAGLRDAPGEPLRDLAARELLEEAGVRAERWDTLLDVFVSPGMTDERSRVFLARDLTEVPEAEIDFVRTHEEADMPVVWVPLEQAVEKVLAGRVHNSLTVHGILAAYALRVGAFGGPRPADAPE